VFYTVLLVVDIIMMRKYIVKGPDGLGMWNTQPVTDKDAPVPARAD